MKKCASLAVALAAAALVACTPTVEDRPTPAVGGTPTSSPAAPAAVQPVSTARLGASWHPGCPVRPEELRLVGIDFRGFDGAIHRGELIVHADLVDDVRTVFAALLAMGFPIERMQTPEHYAGAQDELSMEDNNTSAFNCRLIPDSDEWSPHAYGRAIDINTLFNPCLYAGGYFEPVNAAAYLDRARTDPALIHAGDPAERAFTDRGWHWGGYWRNPDYQHFERP